MATKISLINMKGGVGKSTLAVNLAWHFAAYSAWQKRVLVIDLDPQFNASQYILGVERYKSFLDSGTPTIWNVFEQGTRTPTGRVAISNPREPITTARAYRGGGRMDLLPSQLELAFSLKNPVGKEMRLPSLVESIEGDYDLILIDCAPTESMLTTAAYLSSDWILVPVKPEHLSTIGLPLLASSMREYATDHQDRKLQLAGIVFNATADYSPEEMLAKREVREVAVAEDWYVFKREVEFSRSYPKGAREGRPIFGTSHSRWTKKQNFELFAIEVAERVGL